MKLSVYIDHHGTYTLKAGNEKSAGFLPFTGVSLEGRKSGVRAEKLRYIY